MKANYKIVYYPASLGDLEGIADYIANTLFAPQAAKNLLAKMESSIASLAAFPLSGTLMKEGEGLDFVYRWLRVENYMIFYTVDENAQTVMIMRVLYAAADYLSVL